MSKWIRCNITKLYAHVNGDGFAEFYTAVITLRGKERPHDTRIWTGEASMSNDSYLINQVSFIRWQERCCCDFEGNEPRYGLSHSNTCLERFKKTVGEYKA